METNENKYDGLTFCEEPGYNAGSTNPNNGSSIDVTSMMYSGSSDPSSFSSTSYETPDTSSFSTSSYETPDTSSFSTTNYETPDTSDYSSTSYETPDTSSFSTSSYETPDTSSFSTSSYETPDTSDYSSTSYETSSTSDYETSYYSTATTESTTGLSLNTDSSESSTGLSLNTDSSESSTGLSLNTDSSESSTGLSLNTGSSEPSVGLKLNTVADEPASSSTPDSGASTGPVFAATAAAASAFTEPTPASNTGSYDSAPSASTANSYDPIADDIGSGANPFHSYDEPYAASSSTRRKATTFREYYSTECPFEKRRKINACSIGIYIIFAVNIFIFALDPLPILPVSACVAGSFIPFVLTLVVHLTQNKPCALILFIASILFFFGPFNAHNILCFGLCVSCWSLYRAADAIQYDYKAYLRKN